MSELIVIDVAIFAFLIMIATVIVVTRGRRSSRRAAARREAAAEQAGAGMDPREPITPGLRTDPVPPGRGAYEPAELEQAEVEQPEPEQAELERAEPARPEPERAEPERAELEQTEPEQAERKEPEPEWAETEQLEPVRAGPEQPEPERAEPEQAPSQVSMVAVAEPGRNGSTPEPDGRQDGAGAVTGGGQIGTYYEGADRPIADYLAARGWPEEPGTHDPAGHAS